MKDQLVQQVVQQPPIIHAQSPDQNLLEERRNLKSPSQQVIKCVECMAIGPMISLYCY